ncbi:MAG: Abi-alpha family protein [Leptospiraceae bacterium]|nr:Abi-alpha family protein [Leptospiraceae bacterium]
MDNELEIVKEALDSKLVEKIYDDGLSGTTSQIGKLSEDLIKTARLLLAPIQLLGSLQDRLDLILDRIRKKIPNERIKEGDPKIIGPALENLKYIRADDILFESFINLITKSMDKDHYTEAHPAFSRLLEQMSSDEAIMLYELKNKEFKVIDTMDLDRSINQFCNRKMVSSEIPVEKLESPDLIETYYNHLESLGLVNWPVYKQDPIVNNGTQTGIKRYSKWHLTPFGKAFSLACIPDEDYIIEYLKKRSN